VAAAHHDQVEVFSGWGARIHGSILHGAGVNRPGGHGHLGQRDHRSLPQANRAQPNVDSGIEPVAEQGLLPLP